MGKSIRFAKEFGQWILEEKREKGNNNAKKGCSKETSQKVARQTNTEEGEKTSCHHWSKITGQRHPLRGIKIGFRKKNLREKIDYRKNRENL